MNTITASEKDNTFDVIQLIHAGVQNFKALQQRVRERLKKMNQDAAETQHRIELAKTNWDSANGYYSYLRDFR
ncbi:hypothetical protein WDW86_10125 [Bdellovibrionota bacterium FG-2]